LAKKNLQKYIYRQCVWWFPAGTLYFFARAIGDYKLIGQTLDDAAGECFDKTARILGLDYPGGPLIAQYAQQYFVNNSLPKYDIKLPRPMISQKNYNFSFQD